MTALSLHKDAMNIACMESSAGQDTMTEDERKELLELIRAAVA